MVNNSDWGEWKKTLGRAVDLGETVGMSEKRMTDIAEKVGTYLANNVEPRNDEERLLKELWDAADGKDRDLLANLIVKISDK